MKEIRHPTVGETWLALLSEICRAGQDVGEETRELLNVCVGFQKGDFDQDAILARYASRRHVEEMRKVFFTTDCNQFGHSYSNLLSGPHGRSDLSDVTDLLTLEPLSKRAVVTLRGVGDGKVPCISVIHLLRREGGVVISYFARGQDIFRKFYADALCIWEIGRRVAAGLGAPLVLVSGTISSAHVYLADLEEIETLFREAAALPQAAAVLREEPA